MEPFSDAAPLVVERLGTYLLALPEKAQRARSLLERITKTSPLPLVRILACAQRESAAGSIEARMVVETFGELLSAGRFPEERLVEWRAACELSHEEGVRRWLQPEREASPAFPDRAPRGSLAAEGEPLGRRKQLARVARGDLLDRILQDPHPDVIRNALFNPRVTEALVVRLGARRPVPPMVLRVVSESRFSSRLAVKQALVHNPHCPVDISCRLVGALPRADVLQVTHDEHLPADLRDTARWLLEEKPPRHVGDCSGRAE